MPSHTSQEVLCSSYDGTLQFGRPDSTIVSAGWTVVGAPTHHEATDEVLSDDDTTYVRVAIDAELELGLSAVTDPEAHTGHILRFLARASSPNRGGNERISLRLMENVTEIAKQNNIVIARDDVLYACYEMTLTEAQAALITDYSALRAELTSSRVSVGEDIRITLVEFQVPNLAAVPVFGWLTQQTDLSPKALVAPEGLLAEVPEQGVAIPEISWLSPPELPVAVRSLVPADPAFPVFVPPIPGGGLAPDPVPLPQLPARHLITGDLALPGSIIPPETGPAPGSAAEQAPTFSVEPTRLVGY